jgi:tetratricopeptide (TPR) repeat protein
MSISDIRGVPTSTSNGALLDGFERALRQFQGYEGDPVATIDDTLREDPSFILGHCLRAALHILATEKAAVREVSRSVAAAEALAGTATGRERGHIAAVRAWLDGDFERAVCHWEGVLLDHPRDALALQAAHLSDFYLGNTPNLRDRIARVLPAWNEEVPGFGFVLGMYAFGLEECADYRRAEESGKRAVEINRKDVWAIHAVAHVMEMEGRHKDGIAWMTSRQADWAPDSFFAVHNWWHLALYQLDLGQFDRVLALYDEAIRGARSKVVLDMIDASALLWRLYLLGVDVGPRWGELADAWEPLAGDAYYAFNDTHAMMAFAAVGRDAAARTLLGAMEGRATEAGGTNRRMTRQVGLPVCRGLLAFSRGNYEATIDALLPIRYVAHRFGGSHAQRDLIAQTLIEAAMRGKRYRLARALLAERTALKPSSPQSWRNTACALRALGDGGGAEAAVARADALTA